MKLTIDSSNNLQTTISLDGEVFTKDYESPRDQDVLGFLMSVFKDQGKEIKDIDDIWINPGPGSFTGLRVGASIANALGFALGVPVNGLPVGEAVSPEYGQAPSITPPKSNS